MYFIPALYNHGGMERVLTQKVNFLSDILGYEVIVVTTEQMSKPCYFKLSDNIRLIHLDINFNEHYDLPIITKFLLHKKKLRKYKQEIILLLKEIQPNILISLGGKEIDFLYKLKTKASKICEMHFSMNVRRQFLLSRKDGILWPLLGSIRTHQLIKATKKLDKVVVLTDQDKEQWVRTHNNIIRIANPSPFHINPNPNPYQIDSKVAISIGRLDEQKGYDKLIDAWTIVAKKHPQWKLNIFGTGELDETLRKQIISNGLRDIVNLKGATKKIEGEYMSGSFYVMSSLFEGLPMVLIEAVTFGLPIVSFDCEWGPREIVENGYNGYLVPAGDVHVLANKIIELIEDPEKRMVMSDNAKEISKRYTLSIIMKEWEDLFMQIKNK